MKPSPDLRRIIVEVTNHCNLDCSICLRRSWNSAMGSMAPEVFASFLSDLGEFPTPPEVFFGGYGEPLSHPDILNMIRQTAAAGSRTALITNGTLLTPKLVESMVGSGLKKLWISLDSSHQEAFRQTQGGKLHPNLLDQLSEILQQGNGVAEILDAGLALVLTRNNRTDILDLLEKGRNLGLKSFFITNLEAYSASPPEDVPYTLRDLSQLDIWRAEQADLIELLEGLSASNDGVSVEGPLTNPGSICPFAEKGDLVLRWDGEISPCLPLLYDRTTRIESWEHKQIAHSIGNIRNRSISEIWTDEDFSLQRERLLNNEFSPCLGCRDCWLSEDNRLDCMGFEHPACGGCLWAAGLISCP